MSSIQSRKADCNKAAYAKKIHKSTKKVLCSSDGTTNQHRGQKLQLSYVYKHKIVRSLMTLACISRKHVLTDAMCLLTRLHLGSVQGSVSALCVTRSSDFRCRKRKYAQSRNFKLNSRFGIEKSCSVSNFDMQSIITLCLRQMGQKVAPLKRSCNAFDFNVS